MIKKHVKMKIVSEEQYLKLQDLLFDNGIYWGSDGFHRVKSDYYDAKHIFVYAHGFTQDTFSNSTYFERHGHEEVNIDLYLKTKGTCILSSLKRRVLP
jgi:hypothetical protein